MGIFQQRPEEPTEWAGLPSEPWEPTSPVERLDAVPAADIPLLGPFSQGETITITVEPARSEDPQADPGDR